MTDKEIIDGVNVSKCHHYKNQNCIADYLLTDKNFSQAKCAANPNCYYKQLARKTAECDKKSWVIGDLCYKIHNQRKEINNRLKQIKAFKQENEELKAENQNLKSSLTNSIMSKFISLCNETSKHKQALDEIEKMMKTCISQDICTLCLYSDSCRNSDDFCSYDPEKVILDIICKVKDGKNAN